MRTDRELTALFAGAVADDRPDPLFLDELFELLQDEVSRLKPATTTRTGLPTPARLRLPRRLATPRRRSSAWPLGFAAAAVLAIATAALVLGPFSQVGPPATYQPTSSPTEAPTPAPTWEVAPSATFKTFTSTTYGYSVGYPSNWKTHESAGRLDPTTYPYDFSGGVDYLSATSPDVLDPGVIIAGPRLSAPTDLAGWITNINRLQGTALSCGPADATEPATVAGLGAEVLTWHRCPEYVLWAGFIRGDVGYHVLLIDQFATDNPPLQAADKAMFLRILGTFTFTGPVETFAPPTASPSAPKPSASH